MFTRVITKSCRRRYEWRMIAMVLGLGISMAAAAGAQAKSPAVVRLWNYSIHDKKYQQKMYKLFNERHPDIKIEYSSIANVVYDQTLEAAFIAKDPPDIFLPGTAGKWSVQNLKAEGPIVALNDIAPSQKRLADWMAQFPPILRRYVEGISMFDGKVYAVDLKGQMGSAGYPMYYNKTLFARAGLPKPPATQSEYRQMAAKITQSGQGKYFGFVTGLRQSLTLGMCIDAALAHAAGLRGVAIEGWGPDLKDGKYHYSSPELAKVYNVFINMRKDGSVFPGEENIEDEQAKMIFATDRAATIFGWDWVVGNVLAYNPDCDFDLVLPPTPDDGIRRGYYYPDRSVASGGAWGYLVSKTTKNPAAVWEVIEFISSLEYQEGWVKGGFGISYLPEANKPENFQVLQMYKFVQWAQDPTLKRIPPVISEEAQRVLVEFLPPLYPTLHDVRNNVYLGHSGFEALADFEKRANEGLDAGIKKAQEEGLKVTRQDFTFPDWDPTKDYVQKKR